VDNINVTCLHNHFEQIVGSKANYTVMQEHSCTPGSIASLKALAKDAKRTLVAGPFDPNYHHNVGGVAGISDKPNNIKHVQPVTEAFRKAYLRGRVCHLALHCGSNQYISCYNMYGYSGGAKNKRQAHKTNALLDACWQEMCAHPPGPVMLTTDLNGDVHNFSILQDMVDSGNWHSLNKIAHNWGRPCV
jgi:hypothetical protein